MRRVISDIFHLPRPRVLYSPFDAVFFLQCGSQILTYGEYPNYDEKVPYVGSIYDIYENDDYFVHPIDEFGAPHEDLWKCVHVGFAGDKISPFHKAILLSLRTEFPGNIPNIFQKDKQTLAGYGIGILEDEPAKDILEMAIEVQLGSDEYCFRTGESYTCHLPFEHDYKISSYSDELLCKDIAATLKTLFGIIPAPKKQLVMRVDRVDVRLNNPNVIKLLNDSGEFSFKFVCAKQDF